MMDLCGASDNGKGRTKRTPLEEAIERRDTDAVRSLVEKGAEFKPRSDNLDETLLKVCRVGHPELVRKCVEKGANVNAWFFLGRTPLIELCEAVQGEDGQGRTGRRFRDQDAVEIAKLLIESGALDNGLNPSNLPFVWTTALIEACRAGCVALVELLLNHGANINAVSEGDETALTVAAQQGRLDVMEMLLKHGADINHIISGFNTALFAACRGAKTEAVRFLLEREANLDPISDRTTLIEACYPFGRDRYENQALLETVTLLLGHGVDLNRTDGIGRTALVYAAERGHLDVVKLLLDRGALVNVVSEYGTALTQALTAEGSVKEMVRLFLIKGADPSLMSPSGRSALGNALTRGEPDLVELLLDAGADVNLVDGRGDTPLAIAASGGSPDCVKLLLRRGAAPWWPGESMPVLNSAAEGGHTEVARILLDQGLSPDVCDEFGRTELMEACLDGHTELGELLVEHGADINRRDNEGRTALLEAAGSGLTDLVSLLVARGADVSARDNDGRTALIDAALVGSTAIMDTLLRKGADPFEWDSYWITPMLATAFAGNAENLKLLLKLGADPTDRDILGGATLTRAAYSGDYETVRILLDAGMDPNVRGDYGTTPLMWTCVATHGCWRNEPKERLRRYYGRGRSRIVYKEPVHAIAMVDLLLTSGATVDARDSRGMTPLMHLAWAGNSDAIEELVRQGASIHERDRKGRTALMWAARGGDPDTAKLLLQQGADVHSRDDDGWTPLHHSADTSHVMGCSDMIIQAGAELDATEKNGGTALLIAAECRNSLCKDPMLDLLRYGADVNHRDKFGMTALMHCVLRKKSEAIRYLIYNGADPFLVNNDGRTAENLQVGMDFGGVDLYFRRHGRQGLAYSGSHGRNTA